MEEGIKTIFAVVLGAVFGGLLSFFISALTQRETMKNMVTEGILTHKAVCDERFSTGNVRFSNQDDRLVKIENTSDEVKTMVAWIVGKLKGDINEIKKL